MDSSQFSGQFLQCDRIMKLQMTVIDTVESEAGMFSQECFNRSILVWFLIQTAQQEICINASCLYMGYKSIILWCIIFNYFILLRSMTKLTTLDTTLS